MKQSISLTATQRLYAKKKKCGLVSKRFWLTESQVNFVRLVSQNHEINIEDVFSFIISYIEESGDMLNIRRDHPL